MLFLYVASPCKPDIVTLDITHLGAIQCTYKKLFSVFIYPDVFEDRSLITFISFVATELKLRTRHVQHSFLFTSTKMVFKR